MAGFYHDGKGVARDDTAATALLEGLATLRHGDAEASFNLGFLYEWPAASRKPDFAKAAHLYERAVEGGYGPAQMRLGMFYISGRGVAEHDVKGAGLVKAAAYQGLTGAQNAYGMLLIGGIGVRAEPTIALTWFKRAADQGDKAGQDNYQTVSKAEQSYDLRKKPSKRYCPDQGRLALGIITPSHRTMLSISPAPFKTSLLQREREIQGPQTKALATL